MANATASSKSRIPRGLLLVLLVAWGLLVIRVDTPMYGQIENFQTWVAAAVRNYDYYSFDQIGGMVVVNKTPGGEPIEFYSHHPPLLAWIPALMKNATGLNEVTLRFTFVSATLISIAGLYVFARRLYGQRIALWAAAFFAFSPMISYFGRVPNHDPLGMMAGILFAAIIVNWLRKPNRARFLALAGLTWLAAWTAWPALFYVGMLGITAMFIGTTQHRVGVVALGVSSLVAVLVMMGLYQSWWPNSIDSILSAFLWRTSNVSGGRDAISFTAIEWLQQNLAHLMFFYTPGLFLLSVVGIFAVRKHGGRRANWLLLALFGGGMVYLLVFRNAAYIHNYYKAVLVPACAIAAAMAWVHTRRNRKIQRVTRPALDALVLSALIAGGFVLAISHISSQQPIIDSMIGFINNTEADTRIATYFSDENGYGDSSGISSAVEFYTEHTIEWMVPPNEIRSILSGDDAMLYIYCGPQTIADAPTVLADTPFTLLHNGQCYAYHNFDRE